MAVPSPVRPTLAALRQRAKDLLALSRDPSAAQAWYSLNRASCDFSPDDASLFSVLVWLAGSEALISRFGASFAVGGKASASVAD